MAAGTRALALLTACVLGFSAPVAIRAAEQPLKKITIAYTSYTASHLSFLLEKELGYFRSEGLYPETILLRGAGLAVKGLIAGNFDYIIPTGPAVEAVVRAHQPVRIVFTGRLANFWLVSKPEILSIGDLKGKTVGVMALGTASDFIMREMLKRHGLDPYKDMTFLTLGLTSERFAALTSGAVDSTLLTPPFNLKAVEMGFRRLATAGDYVKWPLTGLATTEEKIRSAPEEVGKMVRALSKGQKFMLTERAYITAKITQVFQLSRDEAAKTYDGLLDELIPPGHLGVEAQRQIVSIAVQAAKTQENILPERIFDDRFVKQAAQELKGWHPQAPR